MRRWILRILVCLFLGAITTVAVAWGISLLSSGQDAWDGDMFLLERDRRWMFVSTEGVGWHSLRIVVGSEEYEDDEWSSVQPAPRWSELDSLTELPILPSGLRLTLDPFGYVNWQERAFGFPFASLTWVQFFQNGGQVRNGIVVASSSMFEDWRVLPLRPIWPGFAIDTLFYGAIWGGVFFGFTSAKRGIRRKRGRCPMCGYDLRGAVRVEPPATSQGCPECGWGRAGYAGVMK